MASWSTSMDPARASCRSHRRFHLDELVRTPLRSDDALVVGIALGFLDVPRQQVASPGLVTTQRRFPGRFGTLKETIDVYTNERATTVIDGRDLQVAVVLIASRLVRRIISYVKEGEQVALGQRIGMIRFGSQVDVVIPDRPGLQVVAAPGQRLRGGDDHCRAPARRSRRSRRPRHVTAWCSVASSPQPALPPRQDVVVGGEEHLLGVLPGKFRLDPTSADRGHPLTSVAIV